MRTHLYEADDSTCRASVDLPDGWAPPLSIEVLAGGAPRRLVLASEDIAADGQPPQCTASSWRGTGSGLYGPGGYNRCHKTADHDGYKHTDAFGNVFVTEPEFRVVGSAPAPELAYH